jgi:hypothetical protein
MGLASTKRHFPRYKRPDYLHTPAVNEALVHSACKDAFFVVSHAAIAQEQDAGPLYQKWRNQSEAGRSWACAARACCGVSE